MKTVCHTGLPGNPTQHRGDLGSSRESICALDRGECKIDPKEDLWDDLRWAVYRFLCWVGFPGRPVWHTVFTGNAQNSPKVPKMGVPPLLTSFLVRSQKSTPPYRQFLKKKWGNPPPPAGPAAGGGDFRTFFQNLANTRVGFLGSSQNRVF